MARNRLRWQHVRAWLHDGDEPELKGRIAVDRDSGALEFPSPSQFMRLAREEGIPPDLVREAFAHLLPKKPKRRRSSRRAAPHPRIERPWWDWSVQVYDDVYDDV